MPYSLDSNLGWAIYYLCDLILYLTSWYLSFLIYKNGDSLPHMDIWWDLMNCKVLITVSSTEKTLSYNYWYGTSRLQSLPCYSLKSLNLYRQRTYSLEPEGSNFTIYCITWDKLNYGSLSAHLFKNYLFLEAIQVLAYLLPTCNFYLYLAGPLQLLLYWQVLPSSSISPHGLQSTFHKHLITTENTWALFPFLFYRYGNWGPGFW